jgi:hypothetical protein
MAQDIPQYICEELAGEVSDRQAAFIILAE